MEPSRPRTMRDLAAAEARSRPSTQFAEQYPAYPEQAQQLRRPRQTGGAATAVAAPPQQQRVVREVPPPPSLRAQAPTRRRASPARALLGFAVFGALTLVTLPVHVLAVFFIYVQVESPGDVASAVPLIAGLLAASFIALLVTGVLSQLAGGFPGRWRARVSFAVLSALIALGVAYAAAITQF